MQGREGQTSIYKDQVNVYHWNAFDEIGRATSQRIVGTWNQLAKEWELSVKKSY